MSSYQTAAPALKFANYGDESSPPKSKPSSWHFGKKLDELFHFSSTHPDHHLNVKVTHTDENSCPVTSDSGCSSNSSSQSANTTLTLTKDNAHSNEYSNYQSWVFEIFYFC